MITKKAQKNKQNKPIVGRNQRFAILASRGELLFHAGDVATLWRIKNKNTLHKTLSRYVTQGLINRLHKGFYSLKAPSDIDPYLLGVKSLHTPAYVSCESVLFHDGVINQLPTEITLISGVSKRYIVAGKRFRSRKMRVQFLMNDTGIEMKNGVRVATLSRAVADMLYFNPKKYFDASNSKLIDWKLVGNVAKAVGYSIIVNYETDASRNFSPQAFRPDKARGRSFSPR